MKVILFFRTLLAFKLNNIVFLKYLLTDNTSSSIIQRGFLDVLMHCISTIHVFSYSVVKVHYYGPLSRPAGAWLRLFFQFPVEAAISDQKAPVLLIRLLV